METPFITKFPSMDNNIDDKVEYLSVNIYIWGGTLFEVIQSKAFLLTGVKAALY
jgi:hypothetical protein